MTATNQAAVGRGITSTLVDDWQAARRALREIVLPEETDHAAA